MHTLGLLYWPENTGVATFQESRLDGAHCRPIAESDKICSKSENIVQNEKCSSSSPVQPQSSQSPCFSNSRC